MTETTPVYGKWYGKNYAPGDTAVADGVTWHAQRWTITAPGSGAHWGTSPKPEAPKYAPIDPSVTSPFDREALAFHDAGWHPVPLYVGPKSDPDLPAEMRYRMKGNPLGGFTGYKGANADRGQIEIWTGLHTFFNFCLRMPDDVIALDVDAYHDGLKTLAALERKYGKLPLTLLNTARDDGSGHLFFRVPGGRRVWQNPGKGIEIICWHWRYVVAPPSIHPQLGTPYGFRFQDATRRLGIPKIQDIPDLPAKWIRFLDTGKDPEKAGNRVKLGPDAAAKMFAGWNRDGKSCEHLTKVVESVMSTPPGGRHDAAMKAQLRLVRLGEQGHPGAGDAISTLGEWATDGLRGGDDEWQRGLVNAVEMIAAEPTLPGLRGCRRTVRVESRVINLKERVR